MFDSYETVLEHMNIIAEATQGSLLLWGKAMMFPEVKHAPYRSNPWIHLRYYFAKLQVPNFSEKLLFLEKDIRHYATISDYRYSIIETIPSFARGIQHIRQTYGMHVDAVAKLTSFLRFLEQLSARLVQLSDSDDT